MWSFLVLFDLPLGFTATRFPRLCREQGYPLVIILSASKLTFANPSFTPLASDAGEVAFDFLFTHVDMLLSQAACDVNYPLWIRL